MVLGKIDADMGGKLGPKLRARRHGDPGLLPGMRVPVYLDPHDERRYYVDVESAAPPIVRH